MKEYFLWFLLTPVTLIVVILSILYEGAPFLLIAKFIPLLILTYYIRVYGLNHLEKINNKAALFVAFFISMKLATSVFTYFLNEDVGSTKFLVLSLQLLFCAIYTYILFRLTKYQL